ncbi:MAG: DUF475 domain-containing protein [Candidatus Paceibacterota bacterium]|jgi:hypothetical protein
MNFIDAFFIIAGLAIFEIVNGIDNAIINAYILKSMSEKWRKIFLFWGLIIAVFVVRGILPFLIVWITVPNMGLMQAISAVFSQSPGVTESIDAGKPLILMGAGVFLLLLYLHWLFLEEKSPLFVIDRFVKPNYGIWFFAFTAVLLVTVLYFAHSSPFLMLSAAIGNAVFFILYGFREQAEKGSRNLMKGGDAMSNLSKFLYLEVLDASFSFDGVLGAFAFTTNILLILIGNGIGAFIMRDLTINNIDRVARYKFLKNGAMTSVGVLGIIIILESFGFDFPDIVAPVVTFAFIGIAFWESQKLLKKGQQPV